MTDKIQEMRATLLSGRGILIPMVGGATVIVCPSESIQDAGSDWYLVAMPGKGAHAFKKGEVLSPFKLVRDGFSLAASMSIAYVINAIFGVELLNDSVTRNPEIPLLENKRDQP